MRLEALRALSPTRPAAGWWRLRERAEHGLLLLPFLLGAVLLLVLPGLLTFGLAFTYFDGIAPPAWWGVRNFQMFFIDPLERIAIANSLYFTALVFLAVQRFLLNEGRRSE